MQIRLTVVDPLGPPSEPRGRAAACDVLVTAPAGTALAAVQSGLASALAGGDAPLVLYAGSERLDAQRCTLGEPPLTDGAVLSLGAPAEPGPDETDVAAQLHVVAGPDAGGVHLLHGGRIHIGRSADADVPLDDPDVSRLHCAVTVSPDGRVAVADLGSTNGTTLDGTRVGERPVRFGAGALLRVGESALRLAPAAGVGAVPTAPDGEGHVRVSAAGASGPPGAAGRTQGPGPTAAVPHARVGGGTETAATGTRADAGTGRFAPAGDTHHGYGSAGWGSAGGLPGAQEHASAAPPVVPGQGRAPRTESRRPDSPGGPVPDRDGDTRGRGEAAPGRATAAGAGGPEDGAPDPGTRKGTPTRGTDVPPGIRRRGLSAWARRLTGARDEPPEPGREAYGAQDAEPAGLLPAPAQLPDTWPDPATLLLTALGPGPRLWEREPGHPEMLTVRLGTADRAAPGGSGLLPAVPVTAGLREVGSLGLAGPRARLAGLARAVVAQLAALHSPDTLEIVLLSTDRTRTVEERTSEWSWLGWLPHVRPTHGQDCRLLLAYDRDQAIARADELLRRLEDHLTEAGSTAAGGGRRPGGAAAGARRRGGGHAPPPAPPSRRRCRRAIARRRPRQPRTR
ncbi:FHA domain-containing protein [Streptomyces sp. NPDC005907]|uniref:FHA domain-containing protein n=1 Tax=Streptomyces sp. NPDC005907 TaxID=3154571 RepID=UPI0033DAC36D